MKGQFMWYPERCITTALNIDFPPSFVLGGDTDAEICNNVGMSLSDLGCFPRLSATINLAYYLTLVISTRYLNPYRWPVLVENGELSYRGLGFISFMVSSSKWYLSVWCGCPRAVLRAEALQDALIPAHSPSQSCAGEAACADSHEDQATAPLFSNPNSVPPALSAISSGQTSGVTP